MPSPNCGWPGNSKWCVNFPTFPPPASPLRGENTLPSPDAAAKELAKRTLTNLYNARPAWLANAHRALDEAVAAAYGWEPDMGDDDVLGRLLELNRARSGKEGA
ncbi:hypothetical protein [Geomobilimonas luticola]|uniref:Uncharacterized protein n=1 Tax=Geomobilimonas luticola TaxID=1114878 RepID=A0ABS5SIR7_9BACT|nr:hypothetical protein [Geomobilimonas luticola]MBT0654691.1 hypothetical protein [Geomobilimonas luticola]